MNFKNYINVFYAVGGSSEHVGGTEKQESKDIAQKGTDKIKDNPEKAGKSFNNALKKTPEGKNVEDWVSRHMKNKEISEKGKGIIGSLEKSKNTDKGTETKEKLERNEKRYKVLDKNLLTAKKEEIRKFIDENPELKKLGKKGMEEYARKQIEKEKQKQVKEKMGEILKENPELKKLSVENLKHMAEDELVKDKVNLLSEKDEDGKTQYEKLQDKYKNLKSLDKIGADLSKEIVAVYGAELADSYGGLLESLPKDKYPNNLEEFDKLVKSQYGQNYLNERGGDAIADGEKPNLENLKTETKTAVMQQVYNPDYVRNMVALRTLKGTKDYDRVNGSIDSKLGTIEQQKAILKNVIEKLPEGTKAREILENGLKLMGISEKSQRIKDFLNYKGQSIDPAKTPWCRAFVNAELHSVGVDTNNSLSSRDAVKSIGHGVDSKNLVPGDLMIVERKGKASDGSPGGHIGVFVGWTKEGQPIILGGNQGNTVKLKVETRPLLGFRRWMGEQEAEKIQEYKEKGKNKEKKS